MEQRQHRLGDIVEDYCPRERRVTDHAVVAMLGSTVKQTRCTACDTEHAFKGTKLPARRKKPDTSGALYDRVLAGRGEGESERPRPRVIPAHRPAATAGPAPAAVPPPIPEALPLAAPADARPEPVRDDGPVHRPLIRATLPRPEGQPTQRPIPEFTIRQSGRNGVPRDDRGSARRPGSGWSPAPPGQRPPPGGRPHGRFSGAGQHGPAFGHRSDPHRSHQPHPRHPQRQSGRHGHGHGHKRSK
jgi:hypothetical protein